MKCESCGRVICTRCGQKDYCPVCIQYVAPAELEQLNNFASQHKKVEGGFFGVGCLCVIIMIGVLLLTIGLLTRGWGLAIFGGALTGILIIVVISKNNQMKAIDAQVRELRGRIGQAIKTRAATAPAPTSNLVDSAVASVLGNIQGVQGTPQPAPAAMPMKPVLAQPGSMPAAWAPVAGSAVNQGSVLFERPGGFLQDGKWLNGKITLTTVQFGFSSKAVSVTFPLGDIASAKPGEKGNLFDVSLKNGQVKNFRAEKGSVWVDKISTALPKM